jgi:hypothetical protein
LQTAIVAPAATVVTADVTAVTAVEPPSADTGEAAGFAEPEPMPVTEATSEEILATEIPGVETLEPEDFDADLDLAIQEPAALEEDHPQLVGDSFEEPPLELATDDSLETVPSSEAAPAVDEPPAAINEIIVPVMPIIVPAQIIVDQTAIIAAPFVPEQAEGAASSSELDNTAVVPENYPHEDFDTALAEPPDMVPDKPTVEESVHVQDNDGTEIADPEEIKEDIPPVLPEPKS